MHKDHKDIPNLAATDISAPSGIKGALSKINTGVYKLLYTANQSKNITVTVSKADCLFTPSKKIVAVYTTTPAPCSPDTNPCAPDNSGNCGPGN